MQLVKRYILQLFVYYSHIVLSYVAIYFFHLSFSSLIHYLTSSHLPKSFFYKLWCECEEICEGQYCLLFSHVYNIKNSIEQEYDKQKKSVVMLRLEVLSGQSKVRTEEEQVLWPGESEDRRFRFLSLKSFVNERDDFVMLVHYKPMNRFENRRDTEWDIRMRGWERCFVLED